MNGSIISRQLISVAVTSVSEYLPGLREKVLAPEADLAWMQYEGFLGVRTIKGPALLTRKGKILELSLPDDARQAFRGLCEALLDARFPEWPQAEGAEGRFLWDLASDTLTHEHSLRRLREPKSRDAVAPPSVSCAWPDSDIPF